MRVLGNQKNNQIYCLLHGEKLLYLVAEESLDLLKFLSQGNKGRYIAAKITVLL